jgi:hypothetical protein
MPTTLAKVDLYNMALAELGVEPIADITDLTNPSVVDCNANWQLALAAVSRSHTWNCLMNAVNLVATPQIPITPLPPVPPSRPWAPATLYVAGVYVTYGGALYQALITNTSTAIFANDLTAGFWFQTDTFNSNPFDPNQLAALYPSGWAYQYPLPGDCLLLVALNDNPLTGPDPEYEIIGINLYTNEVQAVIKYVQFNEDTTRYDSLFAGCVVLLLASMVATRRRQDDTNVSAELLARYQKALSAARTKDAGERKPRRFEPVQNSRFVGSRFFSTNS